MWVLIAFPFNDCIPWRYQKFLSSVNVFSQPLAFLFSQVELMLSWYSREIFVSSHIMKTVSYFVSSKGIHLVYFTNSLLTCTVPAETAQFF
jgi:hypothetical protein